MAIVQPYGVGLPEGIGVVDLGTVTWAYTSSYNTFRFLVSELNGGIADATDNGSGFIAEGFVSTTSSMANLTNGQCRRNSATSTTAIYFKDTTYGSDVEAFKVSVSGKLLFYKTISIPQITTNPSDVTISTGQTFSFSVVAVGTNLQYRWQYSSDGGITWANTGIPGYNTPTISSTPSTTTWNGYLWRCRVHNLAGEVYSQTATLTITS